MSGATAIAVFTRAPAPGQAKTRLIPLLGAEGAAAAQRDLAWRTLQAACAVPGAAVSLWCAGDLEHPFLRQCRDRFGIALLPQCEGDLGMRMADCLRTMLRAHDKALLIGSDCPVFTAQHLAGAAAALDRARMVYTPAEDGGYVLVGARRGGLVLECFEGMTWSVPQVMQASRERLRMLGWRRGVEWVEMPELWDVDTPEDYARAQALG